MMGGANVQGILEVMVGTTSDRPTVYETSMQWEGHF